MADDAALIARVRQDTPGTAHVIHFNNAGCSLPPASVVAAQLDFLVRESEHGGYETAEALGDKADQPNRDVARQLGADAAGVGFCGSASEAWRRILYALSLKPGARVVFDESTYGGNILALLDGRERFGWELAAVPIDPATGMICTADFARELKVGADLAVITHMAAQCGTVNEIAEIIQLAKGCGAFTLLDACQTMGQVPIDFGGLGLDSLIFTGRKYLRAPRGTGGFVVAKTALERLNPLGPDIRAGSVLDDHRWTVARAAAGLELWERNWANHCGLGAAVEYWAGIDQQWAWARIQRLAALLTDTLRAMPGVVVRRRKAERGGIVVFDLPGKDLRVVRDDLRSAGMNVMYAGPQNAPLQMARDNEHGWLRASLHYYNTEEEVQRFTEFLATVYQPSRVTSTI